MDINNLIAELISYGMDKKLICPDDKVYSTNKILEFFKVNDYTEPDKAVLDNFKNAPRSLSLILDDLIKYANENGLLESDTITYKDLFDTAIMGLITPPPSVVRPIFKSLYEKSPKEATDFYYSFSKATNYIRTDRIAKDEKWITSTEFGDLDITINLSKPEKDPRDIAAAGKAKKSGYPSCLLCLENEGYAGHFSHPARQNHRVIPITLDKEQYYLQYSPYVYYNEHCIIFNEKHTPMKINKSTMKKLLSFVELFPHYTAGSNADLPIVGGSILSHDHFQGGGYEFPMVRAPYEKEFTVNGYEDIHSGIIKWPMSTIRLQGKSIDRIVELADYILTSWRSYTDKKAYILSETNNTPHNTITPIARSRKISEDETLFEIDLVLRNNITTDEHPLGLYHPHANYHHIKKENIGLIEVMGLAVLPARLKKEMAALEKAIISKENLYNQKDIISHIDWAMKFLPKYGYKVQYVENNVAKVTSIPENFSQEGLHKIIQNEIGFVFAGVLEDAGVYKRNKDGKEAFLRFINSL
ncbi:MAG: UDP-glucose--hexose-1-phosphate uridylyltransferase [Eubacterium sp.]|nr:UDP-glucose--hexose-1-phosphate uridylyltransferase [Eubacterium sp.]